MALWDLPGAYLQNQKTPLMSCQSMIDYDLSPISLEIRYIAIPKAGDAHGYKTVLVVSVLGLLSLALLVCQNPVGLLCIALCQTPGTFAKLYVTLKA